MFSERDHILICKTIKKKLKPLSQPRREKRRKEREEEIVGGGTEGSKGYKESIKGKKIEQKQAWMRGTE